MAKAIRSFGGTFIDKARTISGLIAISLLGHLVFFGIELAFGLAIFRGPGSWDQNLRFAVWVTGPSFVISIVCLVMANCGGRVLNDSSLAYLFIMLVLLVIASYFWLIFGRVAPESLPTLMQMAAITALFANFPALLIFLLSLFVGEDR